MIAHSSHCAAAWMLLLLTVSTPASAHTSTQVGVSSNFVVHQGKVYFAQADGSLTVLDLDTGAVLARNKDLDYWGTLRLVEHGILMVRHDEMALLRPAPLRVLWRAGSVCEAQVAGQCVVSYDGYGLVECRDLATGRVLWSYNLPGALDLVVEGGRVLVFRSAVYAGPGGVPAVVLLDLQTGEQLLRKTTPRSVHYLEAYFDGERIYLPAGTYSGTYRPNVTRYDQGRPSARFEKLLVWDLKGNQINSIPAAEPGKSGVRWDEPFAFAGRVFARGKVWDSLDAIPPRRPGRGKIVRTEVSDDGYEQATVTRFDLARGTLMVTSPARYRYGGDDRRVVSVELSSEGTRWAGTLPYLTGTGDIAFVGSTQERILLGSNLGHVVCVDAETGQSLWMYLFPTIRQTISSSSGGRPPYLATAAANFRRQNSNRRPESGLFSTAAPNRPSRK